MSDNIALTLEELLSKDIIGGHYWLEDSGGIYFGEILSIVSIYHFVEIEFSWIARKSTITGKWHEQIYREESFPADALIQQLPLGKIAIEHTRRLIYLRGVRPPVSVEEIEQIQAPFESPLRNYLASQINVG